jgi:hypothetical protein
MGQTDTILLQLSRGNSDILIHVYVAKVRFISDIDRTRLYSMMWELKLNNSVCTSTTVVLVYLLFINKRGILLYKRGIQYT